MLPSYWALNAMVWPSGEKTGFDLDADVGGQPARVLAVAVGDPQVVGVDEGDVLGADRRHRQEPGVGRVRLCRTRARGGEKPDRGQKARTRACGSW